MKQHLKDTPNSIVGEMGLDGIAKDRDTKLVYPMDVQMRLFEQQFQLASQLQKPVSMHAVQVYGKVYEFFRSLAKSQDAHVPPSIMLHSYSGSPEIASQLIRLPQIGPRFYFSFSSFVNARSPKMLDRIRAIPHDRILLESDLHETSLVDDAMYSILEIVAQVKGWTLEETVDRVVENTSRFLGNVQ